MISRPSSPLGSGLPTADECDERIAAADLVSNSNVVFDSVDHAVRATNDPLESQPIGHAGEGTEAVADDRAQCTPSNAAGDKNP